MFGSAGSIMSMASGLRAMIDAMMATNSGNPIGLWLDETQVSLLMSVTQRTSRKYPGLVIGHAAMHNPCWGMAAARSDFNIKKWNSPLTPVCRAPIPPPASEASGGEGGSARAAASAVGWGCLGEHSARRDPHPGLRFAPADPPHR